MNYQTIKNKNSWGYLLVLVLVFGSVFFVIVSSFIGYIITQSQLISQKVEIQNAVDIAESGLNYYKWYLAHYPNDLTNGTTSPQPYVHTYYDPEGGAIGEFALTLSSTTFCGEVSSIEVSSTGHTYSDPTIEKTVTAKYARPNVAEYSYIINSNVWAGSDRIIIGPYHSNGGVRMDGTNNSIVTSGQTTWTCTSSFGCSPSGTRDGVFTTTANGNEALFSFPSAPINFTGLTVDLAGIQTKAQTGGGLYFAPSGNYGYRVTFNSNDTITVRRITNTTQYWGYTTENGWQYERHVISNSVLVGTYTIPTSCPVIFVQDKLWIDGVVSKKVTIAAADTAVGTNPSLIVNGDITYTSATTSGLLAIAEQDALVGLVVPDNMVMNGIFVAQNGRFGRNHYETASLSNALDPYVARNSLTLNGTIVSNGREGTKWTSAGVFTSGFQNRVNSYDRNLVLNPPPLIPRTSDVYVVSDWRDEI